ncbi:MAG TPA: hydroxymethylbilane synthase, partial [bacterium]|nr:hydroxymethylbilane synthase [bacterium]
GDEWEGLLAPLDHAPTRACALAERSFLRALQGGCRVPVGALARWEGESLALSGMIADPAQGRTLRGRSTGPAGRPQELGERLAQDLLAQGAGEILRRFGRD